MLKVGIVGAGMIGDGHAGAISQLDDQELVAVTRMKKLAAKLKEIALRKIDPETGQDKRQG